MDASRLAIEQTIEPIARHAAAFLADDSHKYAIDTMFAAATLAAPRPLNLLTSDLEDFVTLRCTYVTIAKV